MKEKIIERLELIIGFHNNDSFSNIIGTIYYKRKYYIVISNKAMLCKIYSTNPNKSDFEFSTDEKEYLNKTESELNQIIDSLIIKMISECDPANKWFKLHTVKKRLGKAL